MLTSANNGELVAARITATLSPTRRRSAITTLAVIILAACGSGKNANEIVPSSAVVVESTSASSAPADSDDADASAPPVDATAATDEAADATAEEVDTDAETTDTETTDAETVDTAPASAAPESAVVPSGLTSIEVESTTEEYFVLYVRPDASSEVEFPVALVMGADGSTTLTDGRSALPDDQYRVAIFEIDAPGDVDGDGIDDLSEVADPTGSNPLNPAAAINPDDGVVIIPDAETFAELSYQGNEVARDGYLAGLEFVKFWIVDADTDHPSVYFMNTEKYRAHPMFAEAVGIEGGRGPSPGKMRGDIVFEPETIGPDGTPGVYRFAFQPRDAYSFAEIAAAYEALASSMPFLVDDLMYYPFPESALPRYESERDLYDAARVPVLINT